MELLTKTDTKLRKINLSLITFSVMIRIRGELLGPLIIIMKVVEGMEGLLELLKVKGKLWELLGEMVLILRQRDRIL